jgi:MazG family protein
MTSPLPSSSTTRDVLPEMPPEMMSALALAVGVVKQLRHPTEGCPWDIKQTHQSLRPYMLEEAYEAVAAIDDVAARPEALKDELGDVLLQVLLHAQVASDHGLFTLQDVAENLADKLIRRHPHVFGDTTGVETPEAVTAQWQDLKQAEGQASIWDKPPLYLPALMAADKISTAAVKEGFKWPDFQTLWACVLSEVDEVKEAIDDGTFDEQEDELGDLLFAVVSLAGAFKISPEVALSRATQKFLTRYRALKAASIKPIHEYSFEELDAMWREAKRQTRASSGAS